MESEVEVLGTGVVPCWPARPFFRDLLKVRRARGSTLIYVTAPVRSFRRILHVVQRINMRFDLDAEARVRRVSLRCCCLLCGNTLLRPCYVLSVLLRRIAMGSIGLAGGTSYVVAGGTSYVVQLDRDDAW